MEINNYELFERLGRLEEQIRALKEATTFALKAAETAILKAETAHEKRLDSVNEFRETLRDQQKTFFTSKEAEIKFRMVEDKLDMLSENQILKSGQSSGIGYAWAFFVAGAGILFGIISLIINWGNK